MLSRNIAFWILIFIGNSAFGTTFLIDFKSVSGSLAGYSLLENCNNSDNTYQDPSKCGNPSNLPLIPHYNDISSGGIGIIFDSFPCIQDPLMNKCINNAYDRYIEVDYDIGFNYLEVKYSIDEINKTGNLKIKFSTQYNPLATSVGKICLTNNISSTPQSCYINYANIGGYFLDSPVPDSKYTSIQTLGYFPPPNFSDYLGLPIYLFVQSINPLDPTIIPIKIDEPATIFLTLIGLLAFMKIRTRIA